MDATVPKPQPNHHCRGGKAALILNHSGKSHRAGKSLCSSRRSTNSPVSLSNIAICWKLGCKSHPIYFIYGLLRLELFGYKHIEFTRACLGAVVVIQSRCVREAETRRNLVFPLPVQIAHYL